VASFNNNLMSKSILKEKSYKFALRIVKLYKFLCSEKNEFTLSKQILKAGTSIGANVEEADQGQSKSDFIHKPSISQKEASETHYWLRLLRDSDYISEKQADSLLSDCEELQKLLTSSIKTAKNNL
jgi:four helix bundle protein